MESDITGETVGQFEFTAVRYRDASNPIIQITLRFALHAFDKSFEVRCK